MRDSDPISEEEAATLFDALGQARVLVLAVSGGPDSTALLWLAARWRDGLEPPPKLIAVTVDHGLRRESARDALAVKKLAGKLQVEHRTLRWTGRKPKTGIQEAARNARYRLLGEAARQAGAQRILTAHTLDDQAETVLFRMARGSGVAGLRGMARLDIVPVPEGRGVFLIRPFLKVPKARLIATLEAAKVAYAVDPSNADPRFARPRFRALMPLLAREGLTAERLGKLAHRVERLEDDLSAIVDQAQFALCPGGIPGEGPVSLDAVEFFKLSGEIGLRLLQRLVGLRGYEGPAELGQFETLYTWLSTARREIRLRADSRRFRRTLGGAMVTLSGAKLTVEPAPPRRTGAKTGKGRLKPPFTKPR